MSFIRAILASLTDEKPDACPHVTRPIDFDMDELTGFLPDRPPLERLPQEYSLWESALETARDALSLGEDESPAANAKRESSRLWRLRLSDVCWSLCSRIVVNPPRPGSHSTHKAFVQ